MNTHTIVENQPRNLRITVNGTLWALQILWGFFFAGSGFGKVLLYDGARYADAPNAVAWYAAVPQPLIVVIGVCELLGGIGLFLPAITRVRPRLVPLAAAGLALTMLLAAGFHLIRGEFVLIPVNVLLGGVAAVIAVGRWSRRPIAPAPLTTRRAVTSLVVLAVMTLTMIVPTWYTMTHGRF
ncbi:DoxX family protein [Actinoplanes oblitus]|uniref:DoxX family protein n=1 Tax=Actinoplanes oblitus TaxID=3040509 RepID=A0ABY8WFY9_9ACTN|nr:DoxX family protein [Actinoplanes oblitus]WIM96382.1 DoxX family protein [Actinoplanes oblitus]